MDWGQSFGRRSVIAPSLHRPPCYTPSIVAPHHQTASSACLHDDGVSRKESSRSTSYLGFAGRAFERVRQCSLSHIALQRRHLKKLPPRFQQVHLREAPTLRSAF